MLVNILPEDCLLQKVPTKSSSRLSPAAKSPPAARPTPAAKPAATTGSVPVSSSRPRRTQRLPNWLAEHLSDSGQTGPASTETGRFSSVVEQGFSDPTTSAPAAAPAQLASAAAAEAGMQGGMGLAPGPAAGTGALQPAVHETAAGTAAAFGNNAVAGGDGAPGVALLSACKPSPGVIQPAIAQPGPTGSPRLRIKVKLPAAQKPSSVAASDAADPGSASSRTEPQGKIAREALGRLGGGRGRSPLSGMPGTPSSAGIPVAVVAAAGALASGGVVSGALNAPGADAVGTRECPLMNVTPSLSPAAAASRGLSTPDCSRAVSGRTRVSTLDAGEHSLGTIPVEHTQQQAAGLPQETSPCSTVSGQGRGLRGSGVRQAEFLSAGGFVFGSSRPSFAKPFGPEGLSLDDSAAAAAMQAVREASHVSCPSTNHTSGEQGAVAEDPHPPRAQQGGPNDQGGSGLVPKDAVKQEGDGAGAEVRCNAAPRAFGVAVVANGLGADAAAAAGSASHPGQSPGSVLLQKIQGAVADSKVLQQQEQECLQQVLADSDSVQHLQQLAELADKQQLLKGKLGAFSQELLALKLEESMALHAGSDLAALHMPPQEGGNTTFRVHLQGSMRATAAAALQQQLLQQQGASPVSQQRGGLRGGVSRKLEAAGHLSRGRSTGRKSPGRGPSPLGTRQVSPKLPVGHQFLDTTLRETAGTRAAVAAVPHGSDHCASGETAAVQPEVTHQVRTALELKAGSSKKGLQAKPLKEGVKATAVSGATDAAAALAAIRESLVAAMKAAQAAPKHCKSRMAAKEMLYVLQPLCRQCGRCPVVESSEIGEGVVEGTAARHVGMVCYPGEGGSLPAIEEINSNEQPSWKVNKKKPLIRGPADAYLCLECYAKMTGNRGHRIARGFNTSSRSRSREKAGNATPTGLATASSSREDRMGSMQGTASTEAKDAGMRGAGELSLGVPGDSRGVVRQCQVQGPLKGFSCSLSRPPFICPAVSPVLDMHMPSTGSKLRTSADCC